MDKKIYIIVIGLLLIGLAVVSWVGFSKAEDENIGAIRPWGLESSVCNATTSPVYKAAGSASSTCEVANMEQIANVDLRFMGYSSTTPTTLSYAYFVSNADTGATTDWYLVGYGSKLFSTSTTIVYPFNSIPLSDLATKKLKVEWTAKNAAADTALEVIKDPK